MEDYFIYGFLFVKNFFFQLCQIKVKSKAVPLHAMEVLGGEEV